MHSWTPWVKGPGRQLKGQASGPMKGRASEGPTARCRGGWPPVQATDEAAGAALPVVAPTPWSAVFLILDLSCCGNSCGGFCPLPCGREHGSFGRPLDAVPREPGSQREERRLQGQGAPGLWDRMAGAEAQAWAQVLGPTLGMVSELNLQDSDGQLLSPWTRGPGVPPSTTQCQGQRTFVRAAQPFPCPVLPGGGRLAKLPPRPPRRSHR